MLTSGIILAKMNHQLFTQTYINILTPFTNLVHCPQIHLPISKVVDKILAAVLSRKLIRKSLHVENSFVSSVQSREYVINHLKLQTKDHRNQGARGTGGRVSPHQNLAMPDTSPRTPRISRLKSQILRPTFLS